MFRPLKIRQYLKLMQARGYAVVDVLAGSGITPEILSDPDFLMDIDQSRIVVANMIALSGDQGIGLEMGNQTELVDFGLVGYLMMSAASAREAVQHWISYSNALIGMLIELQLEESAPDDWSLTISELVPLGFIYNFCVEEQLVIIDKLGGNLTSMRPVITQLDLSYPAPSHHALYQQHFKAPIKFNARRTRISFSSPGLDQTLRGNDKEFHELCARQCELLMRQIGQRSPLVSKIQNLLMRSRGRIHSMEDVTRELNISARSLRRHLLEEGINYQRLINEFRTDMAKEYLRSVSLTTKEIAYLLGFQDTNSFRRAFKLWTGKTVQHYRTAQDRGDNVN